MLATIGKFVVSVTSPNIEPLPFAQSFGHSAWTIIADVAEVASIVREAAAARNGWKVILARR